MSARTTTTTTTTMLVGRVQALKPVSYVAGDGRAWKGEARWPSDG